MPSTALNGSQEAASRSARLDDGPNVSVLQQPRSAGIWVAVKELKFGYGCRN